MTDLYRHMEAAQGALLEHYSDDVAQVEMDWQFEHIPDDAPNRQNVYAVFRWRETLLDTTKAFIQHAEKEGSYPVTEGNFKDNWQGICIEASQSGAEDYAVTLCQALIEIAVIHRHILGGKGISWSSPISRVKHKGDPEIVDKAFDRILEYDYEEEEPRPVFAGEIGEHRETYYQNQLNVDGYRPLNTIPDFKQAVKDIQQDADQRWTKIKE